MALPAPAPQPASRRGLAPLRRGGQRRAAAGVGADGGAAAQRCCSPRGCPCGGARRQKLLIPQAISSRVPSGGEQVGASSRRREHFKTVLHSWAASADSRDGGASARRAKARCWGLEESCFCPAVPLSRTSNNKDCTGTSAERHCDGCAARRQRGRSGTGSRRRRKAVEALQWRHCPPLSVSWCSAESSQCFRLQTSPARHGTNNACGINIATAASAVSLRHCLRPPLAGSAGALGSRQLSPTAESWISLELVSKSAATTKPSAPCCELGAASAPHGLSGRHASATAAAVA